MNFEELQGAWQQDAGQQAERDFQIPLLKKASQPIDIIRKHMKHELNAQVFFIPFLGILPFFFKISNSLLFLYYCNYGIVIGISVYYFGQFKKLFKKMLHYEASLKNGLLELYYEIKLNLEMYKSFNFLLLPFVLIMTGIILIISNHKNMTSLESGMEGMGAYYFPVLAILTTFLVIIFTNWWVNYYYGKHVKKIRGILDELGEE